MESPHGTADQLSHSHIVSYVIVHVGTNGLYSELREERQTELPYFK